MDLSITENNISREFADNESFSSCLRSDEIIDSDEEGIAELDQMLLNPNSIGVKIKSVENNQAKVITTYRG